VTCPICQKPRPHPPTWADVLEHWDCTIEMDERAARHPLIIGSAEQIRAYQSLMESGR
jgi:hypothetical protein